MPDRLVEIVVLLPFAKVCPLVHLHWVFFDTLAGVRRHEHEFDDHNSVAVPIVSVRF